jgi:hypothetical protein
VALVLIFPVFLVFDMEIIIRLDTDYPQDKVLANKIIGNIAEEKRLILTDDQIEKIEAVITKELGTNWKHGNNLIKIETTWGNNNN